MGTLVSPGTELNKATRQVNRRILRINVIE